MKVTIFGTGYVGLVTGACFAESGNTVTCVDIDEVKVRRLCKNDIPFYEPGLADLVERNTRTGRLYFTSNQQVAIKDSDIIFIAVGTPQGVDGAANLEAVYAVAKTIGRHVSEDKLVAIKSTVPVGTSDEVENIVQREISHRSPAILNVSPKVRVVSNPEFLKQGAAVKDCLHPNRVIIGTECQQSREQMKQLYAPFTRNHDRTIFMDRSSAELTKYAANAMLATRISFMNEMANIAERVGADIENIRLGIGSDPRIGYQFIYPGCGYGGSCFPKDVKALNRVAATRGYHTELLNAVDHVNERQKLRLYELAEGHFGGAEQLAGKHFAIWGLSFKPQTSDTREASSRRLIEALWAAGATVTAYDPEANEEIARIYGAREDLELVEDPCQALVGADALFICTEWPCFRVPDFDQMAGSLAAPTVFDGRNLYDPADMANRGFVYYAIGRGCSIEQRRQQGRQYPLLELADSHEGTYLDTVTLNTH